MDALPLEVIHIYIQVANPGPIWYRCLYYRSDQYSSDNNPHDYRTPNKATTVQRQVDEVVGIMQDNINKVMAREGQLENLQDKTEDLHQGSLAFKQKASGVRRKMKWRDMRLKIIIAIVVIILIVVIVVPIVTTNNKKS
ncbi:Vesicle membrane receptor protein (v-SNARE) [Spiromyces aspiralis]|uniref:Vesicle membrane receptor protein (V-SNARE) n=1 Tax=Spiromyces aspiralis TaxID=68401 RepID=A0ACC1HGU2_9FUNG|nr:Vesicle membrane receptor protein (v-SNARE) [Spiromyces aspiralis]